MASRLRNKLALVLCSLLTIVSGLATGLALGCSGSYCSSSVWGCVRLDQSTRDSCCKDLDGDGVKHCVVCSRDYYWCGSVARLGPAYACSSAGGNCS
jgi:hypothetical protein